MFRDCGHVHREHLHDCIRNNFVSSVENYRFVRCNMWEVDGVHRFKGLSHNGIFTRSRLLVFDVDMSNLFLF